MSQLGKRFRRYHGRGHGPLRLHPLAVVGICLVVAVLVALIIGNLLNVWLDDDTYRQLTDGEQTEAEEGSRPASAVRNVNAYPYVLGEELDGILGHTSASVMLNRPDGTALYCSDVVAYYGISTAEETSLMEFLGDLAAFVPYVSGVFYSRALLAETPDLRYAESVKESAILREFLNVGGSEVLLFDLPLSDDSADEVLSYLKTVKFAAGKSPIGVAVPYAIAKDTSNWELLAELAKVCDFMALDLSAEEVDPSDLDDAGLSPRAVALLEDCRYLLSSYDMRLLFDESQTALISTAVTQMRPNFQIIKK